eukprot:3702425-Rhodomonas_salina.1
MALTPHLTPPNTSSQPLNLETPQPSTQPIRPLSPSNPQQPVNPSTGPAGHHGPVDVNLAVELAGLGL